MKFDKNNLYIKQHNNTQNEDDANIFTVGAIEEEICLFITRSFLFFIYIYVQYGI